MLNAVGRYNYMRPLPPSPRGGVGRGAPGVGLPPAAAAGCASPFCRDPNCFVVDREQDYDEAGEAPLPPEWMFCSVVGGGEDGNGGSGGSSPPPPPLNFGAMRQRRQQQRQNQQQTEQVFFQLGPSGTNVASAAERKQSSWKDGILKVSNYASAFCVLDCTVLPLVTLVLPLLSSASGAGAGAGAGASTTLNWLHEFGHSVALYFVLPVGGTATASNYLFSHRAVWIALLGCLGLLLIGSANAGCGALHAGGGGGVVDALLPHAVLSFLHRVLHFLHHGAAHRVANLAGCALLMGSNYLSKKHGHGGNGAACYNPNCNC